jgi:hypothetical protein
VSTDRLVQREENRIHPLDGWSAKEKKERKKENAANRHEVSSAGCFVIGDKEFSKMKNECEHVFN